MVAPVAPLSLTVKASLSSKVVSAQTWTVMVLLGSLGRSEERRVGIVWWWGGAPAGSQILVPGAVRWLVGKGTVTDWAVAPVLVTVNVKAVVPPVLPSAWLTSSIASVGAVASFTILAVGVPSFMLAFVAPLSLTVKASLSSKVVSAQTWTVMVLLGSLG